MAPPYPAPGPDLPETRSGAATHVAFFPPTAPIFGAAVTDALAARPINSSALKAPDSLAEFVNEYFYPALGSRMAGNTLSTKLRNRVDAYATTRTALSNELLDRLASLRAADSATRARELRAFALLQTSRIAALEKEAAKLREDLVEGGLLYDSVDWNEPREWRLADRTRRATATEKNLERIVIRAAAYYQKGLTTEQRGLLLELAIEERETLFADRPADVRVTSDPLVIFFSPETSRLRLPDRLSPALVASLGVYNHDKDVLKRELRDAVMSQEKSSPRERTRAFEDLADRQWPRLRALAERADEVRFALAALPPRPLPSLGPQLPADLVARIETYKAGAAALENESAELVQGLFAIPVSIRRLSEGDDPAVRERIEQRTRLMLREIATFRRENAPRYQALKDERKSIETSLGAIAQSLTDPTTRQPLDVPALLQRIDESDRAFAKLGREEAIYPAYRTAMLEPGLSPEQRRLLFGLALVGLAQPLPFSERMPGKFPPVVR